MPMTNDSNHIIPEKGKSQKTILKELEKRLGKDFSYDSGKILGSMCNQPQNFAKKIFKKYIEKNLGDPGLFPATVELEKEVISLIGSLLSISNPEGHIVSGGTEANIMALWAARNLAKKKHGEVIIPASMHFSFEKAADILGLNLVIVNLNEHYQMDINALRQAINSRTIAIVGMAGTTSLGVVDPIPDLSEIAHSNSIYLHVDAAFGGFIIPFLKELGHDMPDFDFKLPGVSSITIDPHKMGFAPIPAGGILFRDKSMMESISVRVPYLSGGYTEQATIAGTRPGASSLAVWALLMYFGKEGYRAIARQCMDLTLYLAKEIMKIPKMSLVTSPTMNVVGITSKEIDISEVGEKLRKRGWAISLFPNHIRIVIMPFLKLSHIKTFMKDLEKIVDIIA